MAFEEPGIMPEIVESIEIAAAPERVFQALTDPHQLLEWWGDPSFCFAVLWEIDARVDGVWRSRWRWTADGREFDISGRIIAFESPRLLSYTWRDERFPEAATTIVRYDIATKGSGCRVTVTHKGFVSETPDYTDYSGGWSKVLTSLRVTAETFRV